MESLELKASVRTSTRKGPNRRIRQGGQIPGVCYGFGTEATSLLLDPAELRQVLSGPYGSNVVIDLKIMEGDQEVARHDVMLRESQRHPVTRRTLHVDLMVVDPARKVTVDVPIELHGRAQGVALGGRLRQVMRAVRVSCLPQDIPAALSHDVTPLGVKQRALLSEIVPPEGVELVILSNAAFAQVNAPKGGEAGAEA